MAFGAVAVMGFEIGRGQASSAITRSITLSICLAGFTAACQDPPSVLTASPPVQSINRAQSAAAGLSGSTVWLGQRAIPLEMSASQRSAAAGEIADSASQSPELHWQTRAGETVAATLRRWAVAAGYTPLPRFSAREDWHFIVTQEFVGNFEQALIWLSEGFQRQPVRPVAVLFANRTLDLVGRATQWDAESDGGPK